MILLVRHADAQPWTPDPARPLSSRGEKDAVLVADLLAEQPIEAIYCSSEYRAVQTVLPLAKRRGLWRRMTFPDVYGLHIRGSGGAEIRRLWIAESSRFGG